MASFTTGMNPEQAQAALRTLLEGPAASPPAGVVPDFDDTANLDIYVALSIPLCIAFATVAVILRMYTKTFILRVLAWEDCGFYFLSYDVAAFAYCYRLDVIVLAWVKWLVEIGRFSTDFDSCF